MIILERIRATCYQLTATVRKVEDFVLAQHSQVQFMSITQLAQSRSICSCFEKREPLFRHEKWVVFNHIV